MFNCWLIQTILCFAAHLCCDSRQIKGYFCDLYNHLKNYQKSCHPDLEEETSAQCVPRPCIPRRRWRLGGNTSTNSASNVHTAKCLSTSRTTPRTSQCCTVRTTSPLRSPPRTPSVSTSCDHDDVTSGMTSAELVHYWVVTSSVIVCTKHYIHYSTLPMSHSLIHQHVNSFALHAQRWRHDELLID